MAAPTRWPRRRRQPRRPPPRRTPVAAAAVTPAVVLTHEQIEARLLDVVSERTGYPTDMLSLDADLEGDLGIDSIKRVEIAGTFTQTLAEEQRAAIDMELLTSSRTLREVIAVLEEGIRPRPVPPDHPPRRAAAAEAIAPFEPRTGRDGAHRPVRRAPYERSRDHRHRRLDPAGVSRSSTTGPAARAAGGCSLPVATRRC